MTTTTDPAPGPVLRIFEVRAVPGRVDELLERFATTSAAVVEDEPGNRGFFFGRCVHGAEDCAIFVSLWEDMDAVRARFGVDWEHSHLPPGYGDLIAEHSIRHVVTAGGWHVDV